MVHLERTTTYTVVAVAITIFAPLATAIQETPQNYAFLLTQLS